MTTLPQQRTPPAPATVEVHTGPRALHDLGERLDELHARTACPITARRPWQQAWAEHHPEHELLVVVVRDPDGELRAAAPLAVERNRVVQRVVPIGDGPSDAVRLPAVDALAADLLVGGIVRALHELRGPWLLMACHLDDSDPAVHALAAALRHAAVTPGDVSPRLAFHEDRVMRTHVSRNHHQQVRRMRNRLQKAGLVLETGQVTTPEQVAAVWPEVERLCRARDLQLRGTSALDDTAYRAFFHELVATLAARGEVRLTTVCVQSRLAAYVLSFQDGPVRRMWNCRVDPAMLDYGVGRIGNDAALQDALADPLCTSFDWMRGAEPYKASMSDHVHQAVDLTAASNALLWGLVAGARDVKDRLRAVRDGGGRGGRLLTSAQPVLQRLDPFR